MRKVFSQFYKEWQERLDLELPFRVEDCLRRLETFNFEAYEETRNFPFEARTGYPIE